MTLSQHTPRLRAAAAFVVAGLLWVLSALPGGAQVPVSTINPSVPAQNSPLLSAPIRGNFQAAYNDINRLYTLAGGMSVGASCPSTVTPYQFFANTAGAPTGTILSVTDGSGSGTGCLEWAVVNQNTHTIGLRSSSSLGVAIGSNTPGYQIPVNAGLLNCNATECLDVAGLLVMNTPQQTYYAMGDFSGFASFQAVGPSSSGPAYAWSLENNGNFALLYSGNSFADAGMNTSPIIFTPTWQYFTPDSTQAALPNFQLGWAIGYNYRGGGETDVVCNNTAFGGNDCFVVYNWNNNTDTLTQLFYIAGPAHPEPGNVLIGASYPNPGSIAQLNVLAGANHNMIAVSCSTRNNSLTTYYLGCIEFEQLADGNAGNTIGLDFRSQSTNSFAGLIAQNDDPTTGMVTGSINIMTALSAPVASLAVKVDGPGFEYIVKSIMGLYPTPNLGMVLGYNFTGVGDADFINSNTSVAAFNSFKWYQQTASNMSTLLASLGVSGLTIPTTIVTNHLTGSGSAPSCSSTGLGSGSCAILTGGNDTFGVMRLLPTGSPGSSGTITLTFATSVGVNGSACQFFAVANSGNWSAQNIIGLTSSQTAPQVFWLNGSSLTAGQEYRIGYHCPGF